MREFFHLGDSIKCDFCKSDIVQGELIEASPLVTAEGPEKLNGHIECMMRNIFGSINHQLKRCRCYGGTDDHDPVGYSQREANVASVRMAFGLPEKVIREPIDQDEAFLKNLVQNKRIRLQDESYKILEARYEKG